MGRTIVISQPMYFPWVGMFEQLRIADVFVDYTDVAFSKGSFTNRVQVKTSNGVCWLTLPLKDLRMGQAIAEVRLDERRNWRRNHRATLAQAHARAPFVGEMLALFDEVANSTGDLLSDVAVASMRVVHRYFEMDRPIEFHRVSDLGIDGHGSERVLGIVKSLRGDRYVTGHGALAYLDHDAFDAAEIAVEYMDYRKTEYPQQHPPFIPYVTILDLVANLGKEGRSLLSSESIGWRNAFLNLKPEST